MESDMDINFESVQVADPRRPKRNPTEDELDAFEANPCYEWMQYQMMLHIDLASAVRNDLGVSRDSERYHLGRVQGLEAFLNWAGKTRNNADRKPS